jgi:hypothetical protein
MRGGPWEAVEVNRVLDGILSDVTKESGARNMKKIPDFKNEDAERRFWATADSVEYVDWSAARRTKPLRLKPPRRTTSLRSLDSEIEDLKG